MVKRSLKSLQVYVNFFEETDSLEFSTLVKDAPEAEKFRLETIEFINSILRVDGSTPPTTCSSNQIITCLEPVGEAMYRACTLSILLG